MALTKKSLNDHFLASFGQESETARAEKDGLTVGGVYNKVPATIDDGEFSRLQVNSAGQLNVSSGINATYGTATLGSAGTYGTAKITLNGILKQVVWITPNMEDTDSTKITVQDEKGYTLYESGTVAENGTYVLGTAVQTYDIPLYGTTSLVFTAEGTQGGARSFPYYVKVA